MPTYPRATCIAPVLIESTADSSESVITKLANVPIIAIITPRTPRPSPPKSCRSAHTITCNSSIVTHTKTPSSTVT